MTEAEFRALAAQGYNRIPLVLETFADLDTPLSLYVKLAHAPFTFLLESVVGGERFGRYSFIGLPARTRIRARGTSIEVEDAGTVVERHEGDPLEFVQAFLRRYRAAPIAGLPRFCGGLAGMFGYDTVRHVEQRLAETAPPAAADLAAVPDILLLLTEELVVVDNLAGKISPIVYADPAEPDALTRTTARLAALPGALLRQPVAIPFQTASEVTRAETRFGAEAFMDAVRKAKDYIAAGDVMQVVLSQRLSRPFTIVAAVALPRAALAQSVAVHVLLRLRRFPRGGRVAGDPRAQGRRDRHAAPDRGHAAARRDPTPTRSSPLELLADPKESAEHVMLVDLGRNDVGRVAATGSVTVTDRMVVERYSHVMHIVSNVEATLKPGLSSIDVLRATFPAGTVSGAPKMRAIEIIDELEPVRRGGTPGRSATSAFRTTWTPRSRSARPSSGTARLHVQAGGGIVLDSVPESEWQETKNKARAILRAADMVQQGLDA